MTIDETIETGSDMPVVHVDAHEPAETDRDGERAVVVKDVEETARPCFRTYWSSWRFRSEPDRRPRPAGLYWHGTRVVDRRSGATEPVDLRVAAPLEAVAVTRCERGERFGVLIRFRDLDRRDRILHLPAASLAGGGVEAERMLLEAGLQIEPQEWRRIFEYLRRPRTERRAILAERTGWLRDFSGFVLPDLCVGRDDVIFAGSRVGAIREGGDFGRWREAMALLEGNSLPAFLVMAALAAPLLEPLGLHSRGFHVHGPSSGGKTTAAHCAASVWGAPRETVRTWNATKHGLSAFASASNDCVLVLDEIGEASADVLQEIIYAIANDVGRTRANRDGTLREIQTWRVIMVSTGEKSIVQHLAEARVRPTIGVRVRLMDLPVAGQRFGIFDELHGFASGAALADKLREMVSAHHGHAGPALVQQVLGEAGRTRVRELHRRVLAVPPFAGAVAGPHRRAADMFAAAAVAGLLAGEAGILPWDERFTLAAAAGAFGLWQGGPAPRSVGDEALQRLIDFVDRHGADRFAPLDGSRTVRDRAGWYEDDPNGGRTWLFTGQAFREALADLDETAAGRELAEKGVLLRGESDRLTVRRSIEGRRVRVYALRFDVEVAE